MPREFLRGRDRHAFSEVLMQLHVPRDSERVISSSSSASSSNASSSAPSAASSVAAAPHADDEQRPQAAAARGESGASDHAGTGGSFKENQNQTGSSSSSHLLSAEIQPTGLPPVAGIARWRLSERQRTVAVALVNCLNLGVDPPDVVKTEKCARLLCWVDPLVPQRALEAVGKALQAQYERWQPRARYKLSLDPTVDDVKKLCVSLRRSAKQERILFHYNGFGVPRPTNNGEIWVFNKNYTQYIPLSLYELQTWLGSPSICVFDCSCAGLISNWYIQFARQREREAQRAAAQQGLAAGRNASSIREFMLLAACGPNDVLPMDPRLPADVFTSCLTTPIKMALRWFCLQSPFVAGIMTSMGSGGSMPGVRRREDDPSSVTLLDFVDRIPGRLNDRRTPLGELNWIFTAITDTIAWNTLPREIFQKLFRQDLLVASLFRNFLLAERILRQLHCTPRSWPVLPSTHNHPMWAAWDAAVDWVLRQLPALIKPSPGPEIPYDYCPFFSEQLTAFEVWLADASATVHHAHVSANELLRQRLLRNSQFIQNLLASEGRSSGEGVTDVSLDAGVTPPLIAPPEQLPVVLQVLLSQAHRLRALVLLARFLDLGPWAVNLALNVGIFPYVLKLLQSPSVELRPVLSFVWCKILALDSSCQVDLIKDNGHSYFINVLSCGAQSASSISSSFGMEADNSGGRAGLNPSTSDLFEGNIATPLRLMSIVVLANLCNNFRPGKLACFHNGHLLSLVLQTLRDSTSLAAGSAAESILPWEDSLLYDEKCTLRKWLLLYLARFWDSFPDAQLAAAKQGALDVLCPLVMHDAHIEVRASAAYALGCFFSTAAPAGVLSATGDSNSQGLFRTGAPGSPITSDSGSGTDSEMAVGGAKGRGPVVRGAHSSSDSNARSSPMTSASMDAKQHQQRVETEFNIAVHLLACMNDPSPVVRREILFALSRFVRCYKSEFSKVVTDMAVAELKAGNIGDRAPSPAMPRADAQPVPVPSTTNVTGSNPLWGTQVQAHVQLMWQLIRSYCNDPHPSVAVLARALAAPVAVAAATAVLSDPLFTEQHAAGAGGNSTAQASPRIQPDKSGRLSTRKLRTGRSALDIRSLFGVGGGGSDLNVSATSGEDTDWNPPAGLLQIPGMDISSYLGDLALAEEMTAPERSTWFEWCGFAWQDPVLVEHERYDSGTEDGDDLSHSFCASCTSSELSGRIVGVEDDPAHPIRRQVVERVRRVRFIQEVGMTRYLRPQTDDSALSGSEDGRRTRSLDQFFDVPDRFDEQVGIVDNAPFGVRRMMIHSFDGVMCVADSHSPTVRMYDMESCRRLSEISLGHTPSRTEPSHDPVSELHRHMGVRNSTSPSRVEDMLFVNAHSLHPLLLTVCDDANVRIHKHTYARADGGATGVAAVDAGSYTLDRTGVSGTSRGAGSSQASVGKLLTAFSTFDETEITEAHGMSCGWQQQSGCLYVAGNAAIIRRFDLDREQRLEDIDTGSASNVSSMVVLDDQIGGSFAFGAAPWGAWHNVVLTGFGDGSVRLFDVRAGHGSVAVMRHQEWVVGVAMPRGVPNRIITASVAGEVKFWDPRQMQSTRSEFGTQSSPLECLETIVATKQRKNLSALVAHDFTPLIAVGFRKQKVTLYDYSKPMVEGQPTVVPLGTPVRYHDGFLGLRIGQVATLQFDSYLDVLAVGASDSIVSMYATPNNSR